MVRTHSRACALSPIPGNRRRSSIARRTRVLLEHGADRSGFYLGHGEHRWSMGMARPESSFFRSWLERCRAMPTGAVRLAYDDALLR
jgi:hypothetical protein